MKGKQMPVVRSCKNALVADESVRLGEERRLSTGTLRRYVSYEGGRPILIQLPVCYTPGGFLHNFDDGGQMSLVPTDARGLAEVDCLIELCGKIEARFHSGAAGEWDRCVDAVTREVRVRTARVRDVRVFESADMSADDCPVEPGDTVTAIVSPDYVWRSASGAKSGLNLRLVQLLLHTDRGNYRGCLIPHSPYTVPSSASALQRAPPPPPPPMMKKKSAASKQPPPGFRPTVMDIVTARNALRKRV